MAEELQKLQDLLDMGFIQEEDFLRRKEELVEGARHVVDPNPQPTTPTPFVTSPPPLGGPLAPFDRNISTLYIIVVQIKRCPKGRAHLCSPPLLPIVRICGVNEHFMILSALWDTSVSNKSAELTVEDNLTVVNRGKCSGSFNAIRLKESISNGVHVYRVRIESDTADKGLFAIGLARTALNKALYVGGGGNGWAYLSNGQKLFSNSFMKYEATGYKAGDIVGVHVDFPNKALSFSRNGEDLGVAFQGIEGAVYLAVSVPGPDKGLLSKHFAAVTLLN